MTSPLEGAGVVADDLVPVLTSRIRLDGVAMHVNATSTGRSLLLLPLEFSRCLGASGAAEPTAMIRANLAMTAVIFDGTLDARIALHYGPFTNTFCRLRDLSDLRALGVQELPGTAPPGFSQM